MLKLFGWAGTDRIHVMQVMGGFKASVVLDEGNVLITSIGDTPTLCVDRLVKGINDLFNGKNRA
jgi:hypothetical protein